MISQSFFPNFGRGPFPKIAGKSPVFAKVISTEQATKVTTGKVRVEESTRVDS